MNIVLTEALGISQQLLDRYTAPLTAAGHSFQAYARTADVEKLAQEIADADVVMLANMPLPGEALNACTHLKFIDVAFTGVDHVDLRAAKAAGAVVSNASGYSSQAVAELALEMMLSLLRNVPQVEARCRAGQDKTGLVGRELKGKTVGIVGLGQIGRNTARLCQAFGCRVIGTSRSHQSGVLEGVECMPLGDVLAQADIVALHCPLNDSTRGLMNAKTIAAMKDGALLLNLARGPVVDSQALADALRSGKLGGAGIDVFETEPPLSPSHPLLNAPHTLVTPHVAFASEESMALRAQIVFDNLDAFLRGAPQNVVAL
ncbi:MAG: NAD(P)-dependent oxidoreductase [Eubacteriales bacterium]|nr:NAD(P)-dependent oxidoreductase [Eubacteriales bacterium]